MLVLDTSAIIEVAKGSEQGQKIMEFAGESLLVTTPFSIYEALYSPDKDTEKIRELIEKTTMLDYSKDSAHATIEIEKELWKSGKMINLVDIFIAAICVGHGYAIVTCDNDFKKISKLKAHVF